MVGKIRRNCQYVLTRHYDDELQSKWSKFLYRKRDLLFSLIIVFCAKNRKLCNNCYLPNPLHSEKVKARAERLDSHSITCYKGASFNHIAKVVYKK